MGTFRESMLGAVKGSSKGQYNINVLKVHVTTELTKEGEQIKSENNASLAKLLKVKKPNIQNHASITLKSMPRPVEVGTEFVIN